MRRSDTPQNRHFGPSPNIRIAVLNMQAGYARHSFHMTSTWYLFFDPAHTCPCQLTQHRQFDPLACPKELARMTTEPIGEIKKCETVLLVYTPQLELELDRPATISLPARSAMNFGLVERLWLSAPSTLLLARKSSTSSDCAKRSGYTVLQELGWTMGSLLKCRAAIKAGSEGSWVNWRDVHTPI